MLIQRKVSFLLLNRFIGELCPRILFLLCNFLNFSHLKSSLKSLNFLLLLLSGNLWVIWQNLQMVRDLKFLHIPDISCLILIILSFNSLQMIQRHNFSVIIPLELDLIPLISYLLNNTGIILSITTINRLTLSPWLKVHAIRGLNKFNKASMNLNPVALTNMNDLSLLCLHVNALNFGV